MPKHKGKQKQIDISESSKSKINMNQSNTLADIHTQQHTQLQNKNIGEVTTDILGQSREILYGQQVVQQSQNIYGNNHHQSIAHNGLQSTTNMTSNVPVNAYNPLYNNGPYNTVNTDNSNNVPSWAQKCVNS
jgi:hypothetical protein